MTLDHWKNFATFASMEKAAGGPDPQLDFMVAFADEWNVNDPVERAWLAGCYCSVHCIPTAVKLFHQFRPGNLPPRGELTAWLTANWKGLPQRPERKCVRIPANLADCLESFAAYSQRYSPFVYDDYEAGWEDTNKNIRFVGRYMAIKLLELLRRLGNPVLVLPDLRPKGAWSPRRALSLLWPNEAAVLDSEDASPEALALVNKLVGVTRMDLGVTYKVDLSWFDIQVLLCEYRETLVGGFYPGCGHDEEMEYIAKFHDRFNDPYIRNQLYSIRKQIFDNRFLGELNGWDGIRRECWRSYKHFGYIWSDALYKYEGPHSVAEVGQELEFA